MAHRRDDRKTFRLDPNDPADAAVLAYIAEIWPDLPPSHGVRELLLRAIQDPETAAVNAARAAAFSFETAEIRKSFGLWLREQHERLRGQ